MDEMKLLNCLKQRHRGRMRAAKSPVLEARFGISGRALRDIVNELRFESHLKIRPDNFRSSVIYPLFF